MKTMIILADVNENFKEDIEDLADDVFSNKDLIYLKTKFQVLNLYDFTYMFNNEEISADDYWITHITVE
jgi:hypothetical protein